MAVPDYLAFVMARRANLLAELSACEQVLGALAVQESAGGHEPVADQPVHELGGIADLIMDGARACGSQTSGRDIAACRDSAVVVTDTTVTVVKPLNVFADWNIGSRRLVFSARVGRVVNITSVGGQSGAMPLIHVLSGGGFDVAEFVTVRDADCSMVLKQERGGFAGVIRCWNVGGVSQDAFKVSGGNLIEECRIADLAYRRGAPHADVLTCMAADGGVVFRNNAVNWNYCNRTDQSGINNWFRIEPYFVGAVFDDILVESNVLRHANPRSYAMQVVEGKEAIWRGCIRVRGNRMEKAGGWHKILYAQSPRITEWSDNTDLSGAPIPLTAT